MESQTRSFMAIQFRILRALVLFLALTGFAFQLSPSTVRAEKGRDEILVGVHKNFPPQYSIDEKTGKPIGFAIDIMDELAKRAGLKIRYVIFDEWPLILAALREGQIDIIPNLGIVKEREAGFGFTSPVEAFHISIFVRETTMDIHGIDDLRGRKVAVVRDNKGLFIVQEYGKANPVIFNSLDEALLSLLSGNTDAFIYPEPPVLVITRKGDLSDRIKTVGKPLLEVKRAIAVGEEKTDLLNKLDAAVKKLIPTQEYKNIYTRWYGAPAPYWNVRRVLIVAGSLLVLVIVLFVVWHYLSLRHLNGELQYALEVRGKSEAKFKGLYEESPVGIELYDHEGILLEVNKACLDIFGISDVSAVRDFKLFEDPNISEELKTQLRRGENVRYEIPFDFEKVRSLKLYETTKQGTIYLDLLITPLGDVGSDINVGYLVHLQDITDRKRAEEALRKSEDEAKRLAQENAIMAEIGRIINSSLNIDEVYERFTKEVAKLVSFDRIMINDVNIEKGITFVAYVSGTPVSNRKSGIFMPLAGSATAECLRTRSSMLIQPENIDECSARFPGLLPTFQAGLRSIIMVPLISKDQFTGVLSLRSLKPKAYSAEDVRLAEKVANQIAGAIANAQLFAERKKAERRQILMTEILSIINESPLLIDAINRMLVAIKREMGFDAVGIRLKSGDDFPYYVQNGFSEDFLLTENTLAVRDQDGGICRDERGNIRLECTCGLVISGLTDPTNPFCTQGGSFWTNDSLPLLALPAEEDPRLHPRNNCIHQGYMSVAIIPIRVNQEIVGLLQLNDRKKDCFTLGMIHYFEGLASSIGIALTRKQAEEKIHASLREKETMLREIHHRVKNNMQVISSLLNLQAARLPNEASRAMFQDSVNRVKSMAAIHAQLYQSGDMTWIDFGDFIKDMVSNLRQSYERPGSPVVIEVEAGDVRLGIDPSIPCGLIINELVSNALKHAFPGGREGKIRIGMRSDHGSIVLTVSDNGIGFPEQIDPAKAKTLGYELVNILVRQIGGKIDMRVDGGTVWMITFPLKKERGWRSG